MIRIRLGTALLTAVLVAACGGTPPPAVAPSPREPAAPTGFVDPARDVAADLEARNELLEK